MNKRVSKIFLFICFFAVTGAVASTIGCTPGEFLAPDAILRNGRFPQSFRLEQPIPAHTAAVIAADWMNRRGMRTVRVSEVFWNLTISAYYVVGSCLCEDAGERYEGFLLLVPEYEGGDPPRSLVLRSGSRWRSLITGCWIDEPGCGGLAEYVGGYESMRRLYRIPR